MTGRRVVLSVQHSAAQATMKAMMRRMRPMIIRAATAWAQAEVKKKIIDKYIFYMPANEIIKYLKNP